jgi:NAD(P)-dependent dehydrogenase (short-subunit alcohol dehydrogenase family)
VGRLTGRVAIVTGAGRGLGREHALALAEHGASVVVNDLGAELDGTGADPSPGHAVVEEITRHGGSAVLSGHDVADWEQAEQLVRLAVEAFGDLHVLVNNAGILRDRTLANLAEDDWDAVIRVHLKGHAATTRHAMGYWRDAGKRGESADRSVVMTSSIAGLAGNFGQAAYASAKAAVLALSSVVRLEGARYAVRSNVVSPGARTRLGVSAPGAEEELAAPDSGFDHFHPGNVSPLVAWLADAQCPANGQVFHAVGSRIVVSSMPPIEHEIVTDGKWTLEQLDTELPGRLVTPGGLGPWLGLEESVAAR